MPPEGLVRFPVQLLFVGLLGLTAWAWGEAVLRHLLPEWMDDADGPGMSPRWPFAATLGLGLIGQGLFVLGLAGLFDPLALCVFFAGGHALAARCGIWNRFVPLHPARALLTGGLALASLPTFVLALYPPTGFDASTYHLPYASRFLELGGLAVLPELRFPIFPQLGEMLFVPALLAGGDEAAQLTQALAFFLGAGVAWSWGSERGGREMAFLVTGLWVGLPLALWIGAQAYVDVSLALFVMAGAATWDRFSQRATTAGAHRGLLLAGLFLGCAAATKYFGLFFVAATGLMTLLRRWRSAIPFSLGVLLVALPWYGRLVWETGNPVFPFYASLFGESEWTIPHAELGSASVLSQQLLHGLDDLATLPWDAIFRRERFNLAAPLSPWYLLLVPLSLGTLVLRSSDPRNRRAQLRWLLVVGLYGVFWLTTFRDLRFWLPALPLFHLATALGIVALAQRFVGDARRRHRLTLAMALLLALPGWLYGVYKIAQRGPLPVAPAERTRFLNANVPGHAAIDHLDREHGRGYAVYGLHAERLRHYADGRFGGDWFGPERFALVRPLVGEPDRLAEELTSRGFDHLLVRRDGTLDLSAVEESSRFQLVFASDGFVVYHLE